MKTDSLFSVLTRQHLLLFSPCKAMSLLKFPEGGQERSQPQEVIMTTNLNTVNVCNSVAFGAVPYFQPILTPTDESSFAYEALGRLKCNGLILAPRQFLPRLEHTPYLAKFDRVILSRAIEQMANWINFDGVDVKMHVNASADVLAQASYADFVDEELSFHQVSPERLTIEVVETCQFWKSSATLKTMTALKQLGVKIAIDDFPCWSDPQGLIGWLELNSDRVDSIKIDQSLVRSACDDSLCTGKLEELMSYIILAHHKFGLTVVAEGVLNEQDMLTMQLCEVDALQGFGIGRPQPANQAYHLKSCEEIHYVPSFTRVVPQQNFATQNHL